MEHLTAITQEEANSLRKKEVAGTVAAGLHNRPGLAWFSLHSPIPSHLSSLRCSGHAEDAVGQLRSEPAAGGQRLPQAESGHRDVPQVSLGKSILAPDGCTLSAKSSPYFIIIIIIMMMSAWFRLIPPLVLDPVWRIWTGSSTRCCPSRCWTSLKPSPTSCRRYLGQAASLRSHAHSLPSSNAATRLCPACDVYPTRRRCRRRRSRPCSCRRTPCTTTSATRSVRTADTRGCLEQASQSAAPVPEVWRG